MRSCFPAFLLTLGLAGSADAQLRPPLSAAADTNDATAYYDLGLTLLQRSPAKAADAFYWATQLNPSSPDAFYARRVALLMARPHILVRYWGGDSRTLRDRDVQRADSLYLRALVLNPFFFRKLDGLFFSAIIRELSIEAAGTMGDPNAIERELERYLAGAPAALKAWRAYSSARFEEALRLYAIAIKDARKKAPLRIERARLFFQLDRPDSALAEMSLAAEEMRKAEKKDLVFVYESKVLVEHTLGMVHLRLGQTDAAREAFARALQEDLAYSPAHVQLGFMALDAKDTVTAISEFDLAVQINGNDPALRYQYGYTLETLGKAVEAEVQLRKAIAINAHYAAPRLILAKALVAQNRNDDAIAEVRAFLSLAARTDPRRPEASQLLASLGGAGR